MKAVIQAGGKGTRLRSITKDLMPKPMVPIKGKPLLVWQIEKLKENGITDIFIITGHLGTIISEYCKDGIQYGVHITYIHESIPLGSAGALFYLRPYLCEGEDILLLYGDIFFDIYLQRMLRFHLEKGSELTVFAHPNTHPEDSDLLETDEMQRVTHLYSKKDKRDFCYENLVNAAFYIVRASIILEISEIRKMDFEEDILKKKISEGKNVYAYRSTEYVKDAGTEERLCKVEFDMESGFISKRNLMNKQKCIFLTGNSTFFRWNSLTEKEAKAIGRINSSEYLTVVVFQANGSRELCVTLEEKNVSKKMHSLLGKYGVYVDDTEFCQNAPQIEATDEKMFCKVIEKMVEKYNIFLPQSWIIGGSVHEISAGKKAGMNTVIVVDANTGNGKEYIANADYVAADLKSATEYVCPA